MTNLKDVQHFTRAYPSLQGLKMIPIGLWFLAFAAGWLGQPGDCSLSLPALVAAILLTKLVESYYDRQFGKVKTLPGVEGRMLLGSLVALAFLWIASYIDFGFKLPVNLFGLSLAALLIFVFSRPADRGRTHYLIMGVLIALISLLPLAGISTGSEILQPPGISSSLLIAAILIIGGALDHYLLVRTLKTVRETINV